MNYCFRCKITQEVEAQQIIALLIVKKYLEVKEDKSFLNYISKNLRDWSDTNILNGNAQKLTYKLLELDLWKN